MDAAARRICTTKAAQCTSVDKAAFDAKGDNVSIRNNYSDINTGDSTGNNGERPGQLHNHDTNNNDN